MIIATSEGTEAAGAALAAAIATATPERLCVWLQGELGAGKTTFCRGLLRAMGHKGRVPSPTYTLIEPYDCGSYQVYHLDLYRLREAAELEYLGLSELWESGAIFLIEWPTNARAALPAADLEISLALSGVRGDQRELTVTGFTRWGTEIARLLAESGTA